MHLRNPTLNECPDDETFLHSFPNNGQAQRQYPPVALVESVSDVFCSDTRFSRGLLRDRRDTFSAFSLHAEVSIRTAAIEAFQFQEGDLSSDLPRPLA